MKSMRNNSYNNNSSMGLCNNGNICELHSGVREGGGGEVSHSMNEKLLCRL